MAPAEPNGSPPDHCRGACSCVDHSDMVKIALCLARTTGARLTGSGERCSTGACNASVVMGDESRLHRLHDDPIV